VQEPNPTHGLPPDQSNPPKPTPQPTHTTPIPVQEPNPTRGQPPVQSPIRQPQTTPQPERPLFNKAVPPEPHPSFERQQQAIEQTDPGRPLSPSQTQNVRQNRPPGPAQQQEAPHPAPAPRPAPQTPPKTDDKKK
jgi:hypothetical protein